MKYKLETVIAFGAGKLYSKYRHTLDRTDKFYSAVRFRNPGSKENPLMTTSQVKEQVSSSTELLSTQEQTVCKQIAQGEAPHNQRALALLALHSGSTQAQAAQKSGLSQGQVKYWLAQFKKQRLAIFAESMLEETKAKAESAGKKAKKSIEKTVDAEKNEKVKKEKKETKGKKSKKSEKKAGKSKKDKKDKKDKKKKKGKNDKKKK